MKLLPCSSVPIAALIGALLVNENGAEFIITSVNLHLDDFSPWISIVDANEEEFTGTTSIPFDPERLKGWSIQLGNSL
jgi:hypothetical protein